MKKSSVIARNILLSILFVVMLYSMVRYLGFVVYPKLDKNKFECQDYSTYYFAQTKRNSIDTVFVGSSHQFCSIDVNILNKEYGMSSILLTSSGQNNMASFPYYAVMEAIELQHPDTIVLEAMFATSEEDIRSSYGQHVFYDSMPNYTKAKYYGVKELGEELDEPWYYYYLPLTALHDTWKKLTLSDFILPQKLPDGEQFRYYYEMCTPQERLVTIPQNEKVPMTEKVMENLDRIVSICDENNVELILYAAPYIATETEQGRFNALADYAAQHGIRFYNLLYETDNIGIDYDVDFMDYQHLNHIGQEKFTRYCAEEGYFLSGK